MVLITIEDAIMRISRLFFALVSLLFFPISLSAQEMKNIVLLPIDVAPEFEAQKELIGTEIQKALSNRYTVFFGEIVEEALQEEYSKDDCSAESCVQNVAIKFNGEVVVDASIQLVDTDTYFRMKFLNVITGELEAVIQEACSSCSFAQLLDFVGAQTFSVQPVRSSGLTALLDANEAPPVPLAKPPASSPQNEPVRKAQPSQPVRKAEVKGPSYWRWGLGALVLAGAGGGGGGGGGDSYSGGGSTTTTTTGGGSGTSTTTGTPFDTPGSEYMDNPNMLTGGYTFVNYPASERHTFYRNAFSYGANGNLPDVETTGNSHTVTYSSAGELFRFQANNGSISRMTIVDGGESNVSQFNFDTADGGVIEQSLGPSNVSHLSFFSNDEGQQFLGLALTQDYQSNVGGIARSFFGVAQKPHWSFDREIIAFHGGQPADDAIVSSGAYELEGYSAGHWVTPNDFNYWTTSNIEVEVDFTAGQAQLISFNTFKSTNPSGANSWSNEPGLDFSVEGGVSSNPKSIGARTTDAAGDVLPTLGPDGVADGGAWRAYFYSAPSASEVSGGFTFGLKESNREAAYVGAFGARRD